MKHRVTTFDEVDARIIRGDSPLVVHAGWGLYFCAVGAIAIVIGAVLLAPSRSREASGLPPVGAGAEVTLR